MTVILCALLSVLGVCGKAPGDLADKSTAAAMTKAEQFAQENEDRWLERIARAIMPQAWADASRKNSDGAPLAALMIDLISLNGSGLCAIAIEIRQHGRKDFVPHGAAWLHKGTREYKMGPNGRIPAEVVRDLKEVVSDYTLSGDGQKQEIRVFAYRDAKAFARRFAGASAK